MDKLRNVILVGHQASGKTTLAESILFNAGVNSRAGRVEDGNTTMDSSPEEISKVISIDAGIAFCEIAKTKVNIIDTPGYEDFVGQVLSCLPVVEGGVIVMSAESGVEAGTVKTWGYLDYHHLPRIVCVNKMDKEHADFDKCVEEAQSQLGAKVAPFQIPIGQGDSFKGVVDVLNGKAYVYSGDGKFAETDVPADLKGKVDAALQRLVDFAAETDDSLLEKFLGGEKLSDDELRAGLAAGCVAGTLVPLFVVSSVKNIGVHQLMESIVTMLPSPAWRSEIDAKVPGSDEAAKLKTGPDAPVSAFVFKFMSEKNVGDLSYFRVFGGDVAVGKDLHNANVDAAERMGQLFFIQGRNRVDTESVEAGDIGAAVKLKGTRMGHTLCERAHAAVLPDVLYPEPTLTTAIAAKVKGEEDKVATGLAKLKDEDPTFKLEQDPELRQMLLSGQGELHLDVVLARLKRKSSVEVEMTVPKIPYRETITAKAEAQGKYKKQSGGRGQYGRLRVRRRGRRRRRSRQVHPRGREGRARGDERGRARRIHGDGREGRDLLRFIPRRRFVGQRVQGRGIARLQSRRAQGEAGHPRADHGRRGARARRFHGGRHGRSFLAPRQDTGHGAGRRIAEDQGAGSPRGAPPVLDLAPLDDAGTRRAPSGIFSLRGSASRSGAEAHRGRRGGEDGDQLTFSCKEAFRVGAFEMGHH
jgi:elongation factor G